MLMNSAYDKVPTYLWLLDLTRLTDKIHLTLTFWGRLARILLSPVKKLRIRVLLTVFT